MNESQKYITLPPVTADSAAMFFEDENPAEARLLEVQHENARYIWQSIVQREDFRAAQYMTQSGQTRILAPSTRDGIDWQLSYIGADGIPNMHGDYTAPEHRRDESDPEEIFRSLLHPEEVKPQGHSMEELFKELARDGGRHERTVTLMLDEAQKGDNSVDERNSLFIAEMAKRYAVYNRTPISPESELFRAYEEKIGTVDRAEYQRILTDTLITGEQPPRMAILQPQMDGLVFRRYEDVRRNENFKSENYEIVYISDEMGEATPNEVYAKFNEPGARPGDYYGTSVSTGNILVYERDGKFTAHFVENAGFTELPEDFLDFQTRQKIQFGLDVRQEQGLLQRNVDFVTEQGIDLDVSQDIARLEAIKRDFEAPFRLADLRTVNEAHQNVLETIYEYQQESGRDYGIIFSDGMYYAADRNDSNRIFSNNAEDYREEINNRLAMVAQRYAQENKTAYRMEATPGYRGEPGQYPFFVQRYEQAEPGRRTPEEVVFMGDAEAASYFTNHINAMTALGEELLTNVELRQTLNMPVLQGGIDNLLITDVERENNALMERVDERTDRIQRAMEAAGYTYDEINSAEEPDGEQYFTYEGGQMRFANETEALEWISGVVFDDPERQEAVYRALHPEAFQNAEDLEQYARQNPDSLLHAVYGQEEAERPHREDVQESKEQERHTYYSLHRPVSPGTYPRDGLVDFENFDRRSMVENIGREAWAVLHYDRELTDRELRDYELTGEPQITPIREFFDNEGKILVGSDIGLNRETGQVDRTRVYEAVRDFENANREMVRYPVIDRDGDYADRTTLYTGYDQYVGMSHMQDGELTPYRELIETAVQESERGSSKDWLRRVYTAEVYYAHKNKLTPEQIQYMVEKSAGIEAELPVFTNARDSMRNIRHAFEQRMTPEQVDISLGQEDFVQQTILSYLHNGGDMERAKALRGADMATAHYITLEYSEYHLPAEKAAAIVQTLQEIHDTRLAREGFNPTTNFYMDEDYLTESLVEISRDSGISAEAIRQIGVDFSAQTQERDLRKFVESQEKGIATYYPHGEDGSIGMKYIEPERKPERTADRKEAMQEYTVFMESGGGAQREFMTFPTQEEAEQFISENNGVWRDGNDFEWGLSLEARDKEIIIQNYLCYQIDEWAEGKDTLVLGQAQDDPNFYYARVSNGDITREYEFDHKPTHEEVLDRHIDQLAAEDIDRYEAEYGADGYRAFPGNAPRPLTAESITDIAGSGYEYSAGSRESVYIFDCRINGEPATLTYSQGQTETFRSPLYDRGDIESTFSIHTDGEVDIWQAMPQSELEKLESRLHEEADFYMLNRRLEQATDIGGINYAVYSYTEDENMRLTDEHRAQFYEAVNDKVIGVVREQIAAATPEQLPQVRDMIRDDISSLAIGEETREMLMQGAENREAEHRAQEQAVARTHGEEERSKEDMTKEQERATAAEGVSQPEEKKSARDLLAEQLTQGVKDVMNSDNYKNWLSTSSRLFTKSYSFNNAMLIFKQQPEASYAMGYEAWKEYGRYVAQGAQGAKIFVPVMAYEKTEGALHRMIMSNLREQLKQNPGQTAVYKVGMSKCEFTMNESGQVGLRINGKERGIFANQQDMKKFISNAILGKIPMYYNVGTVFDVKDTIVPEYLWVKKGYTKDEVVKDENGKPVKNKRGEVKIVNTPERQARFQPSLDLTIAEKDPAKMAVLYESLKAVSERNGIPVTDVPRDGDETLRGGADGYFSRQFSEQNPKGFIVMPDDLEPTKKCSVLMHEMGHSDLHGNLAKLAAEMQEKNIPRNMREIQAESVAFATASQFGIETDTSSFTYLAAYTQGFDLQDLKKSLDVIYNECKKLTQEIGAELDARGLNLDLTEKPLAPMEKESVEALSKQYTAYALEQSETIHSRMSEIPALAADNRANPDLLSVLKEQKSCLDRQEASLAAITGGVEKLQGATTREAQNEAIEGIEAAKRSIESEKTRFSDLTTSFTEISSQSKATLKEEFSRNPEATLEAMKQDYPKLKNLSAIQLSYVAQSEYIKKEYGNLLKSNPEKFVDAACQRAEALDKVVAKNGAFVEVNFCEQWTDKSIVQGGALLHPNVANAIVKQAETQIRGLRSEAEKMGDYFPYTKCDLTVFHKTETGKDLNAYRTRVDIGDKGQTSLTDHLTQLCGKKSGLVEDFSKATRERGAKDKVAFNESPETHEEAREDVQEKPDASTREEWTEAIEQEKAAGSRTQESPEQEKQKGKDNKEH